MRSGPKFCKQFVGFFHFVIAGGTSLEGRRLVVWDTVPRSGLLVWDAIPWEKGCSSHQPQCSLNR